MTRRCEWCGKPLSGRQEVACNDVHKLKVWRWKHALPAGLRGLERPPEGSPLRVPSRAVRTAPNGADGASRVSNGGLQVSFEKAVRALRGYPTFCGENAAREALANALSAKQRARLEGRS